jgi:hypothetical protein
MPRPTSSTAVQRPDLGSVAYEYMMTESERGFIGLDIMPVFEVMEQSADYPVIPIESLLKIPDVRRTAQGAYNRGDWKFETGSYSCEEYGFEQPVDDVEARLYQRFFDAEVIATEIAVDNVLRAHEARVQALVQSSADSNVGTEWSTAATATPYDDVKTAKQAMRAASGLVPNVGVCSLKVFENLLATSELQGKLQYTTPIELLPVEAQRRMVAQYFGLDNLLVGGAVKDSAKKGQSFSISDLWDDEYFSLVRVSNGSPRLREPVYGRTFLWVEDSPQELMVEQYREEAIRSEIYRARHHVDEAVIFSGALYTLGNITA